MRMLSIILSVFTSISAIAGDIDLRTIDERNGAPARFEYGVVSAGDIEVQGSNFVIICGVPNVTTGYRLMVDSNTEQVVAVIDHASPKRPKPEQLEKAREKADKMKLAKTFLADAKSDKQKIDAIYAMLCAMTGVTNAP